MGFLPPLVRVARACRVLVLAAFLLPGIAVAAAPAPGQPFTFVVIGHLRGGKEKTLYARMDELLAEVRAAKPDLIFLTGDLIWGDVEDSLTSRASIVAQWEALDARLNTLGVPVYRVPGNHDIHDPVTRDVFYERYGKLPRVVTFRGSRFFLFNTVFTPEGNQATPVKLTKTVRLDSAQVGFLRDELARGPAEHDFLVMHSVLWFYQRDPWWTEVHPLLAERHVNAVFTGDLGPAMYTHMVQDSVQYFRTTLNAIVDKGLSADAPQGLIRTLQFENFLQVRVNGPEVEYAVRIVGATTSPAFGPDRWRAIFGDQPDPGLYYDPASYAIKPKVKPKPSLVARMRSELSPKRAVALLGLLGVVFFAGYLVGTARGRAARPAH